MEVWKEFDHNEITHSVAHHLMAIHDLISQNGYARVTDVARYLKITKGSASITLKSLKEKGYIDEDDNKFFRLTDVGKHTVNTVLSKRRIFIKFFRDVLQVKAGQAEIDACKIEHLISEEAGGQLLLFLQFILSNNEQVKSFLTAFREFQLKNIDPAACRLKDECFVSDLCEEQGCLFRKGLTSDQNDQ